MLESLGNMQSIAQIVFDFDYKFSCRCGFVVKVSSNNNNSYDTIAHEFILNFLKVFCFEEVVGEFFNNSLYFMPLAFILLFNTNTYIRENFFQSTNILVRAKVTLVPQSLLNIGINK